MKITNLDNKSKILIVGLGLIGGSYAKALSKHGYQVKAITRDQKDIDYAVQSGIIADGTTEVNPELIAWSDITVLALYPHTLLDWVRQNAHLFTTGTLVTDVTGVKGTVVADVQSHMPDGVEFIAAHPMAGREKSGVEYSDDAVFRGANYIVVPTEKNTPEAVALCSKLGEILGFHRISTLTVKEHDRMIAFLSQLTHSSAVALMCATEQPGLEAYTGDSFRDLTRIARIDETLWSELFLLNKDALLHQLKLFTMEISKLERMLMEADKEGIKDMMRRSTARRKLFDKEKPEK